MKISSSVFVLVFAFGSLEVSAQTLDEEAVNSAAWQSGKQTDEAIVLKAQILLDRKRYSPGVIDGLWGESTKIAVKAFQADSGLEPSGRLAEATFAKLGEDAEPVIVEYEIASNDVEGDFVEKLPEDIAEMAKLKEMAYSGPQELLSEKFHTTESLLKKLNPGADFAASGTRVFVPSIESAKTDDKADRIEVDKSEGTLRVLGRNGELLALYPATIGSKKNPAPSGETKVERVAKGPTWNYDPKLELEGHKDRPDRPVTVPAGPNNPVGTVWIALDRDHYGIHGSADPEEVGKTVSSGCVRLTNWDVEELAGFVQSGMTVNFSD